MSVKDIQLVKGGGLTMNLSLYYFLITDGKETQLLFPGQAVFGYDYEIIAWQDSFYRVNPDKWQYVNPEDDPNQ